MTVQQLAITVTPEPDSVARARHFVRAAVGELTENGPPGDLAEVAELMVSELTANAVSLRAGEVTITVRCRDDRLRVEVRDFGYGRPELSEPAPLAQGGGRGLLIVATLADAWGVDEFLPGKIVWFELEVLDRQADHQGDRHSADESSDSPDRRSTSVRRKMRER